MPLDGTFFKVEIDGAVAHLIMNRPDKANAMTPDFWDDLPRLTRKLDQNPEIRAKKSKKQAEFADLLGNQGLSGSG